MHCPNIKELPSSPPGKTGWPWTEGSVQPPDAMPGKRPWPKISIVTPSYNQGEFLEETIRSILLQGYPDLEYIVIDGGSDDNSIEIIKKYEPWLKCWVSEKDKGHSHALNKGFERATGDILAWLNSDDYYEPGILTEVAKSIDPSKDRDIVVGDGRVTDEAGKELMVWKPIMPSFWSLLFHLRVHLIRGILTMPPQASVFWHRKILEKAGFMQEDLNISMDYEYWLRVLSAGFKFHYIPKLISNYRFHSASLSGRGWHMFFGAWRKITRQYYEKLSIGKKIFAECFWYFLMVPVSVVTFPIRTYFYLIKRQKGRFW